MTTLTFTTEKRRLGDLIPWDKNPRIISKKVYNDLKKSMQEFVWAEIPVINLDNTICAAHQRWAIARELWGDDLEIDVRVPHRMMTEKEFKKYNIKSNAIYAAFNWEILANEYDAIELLEWGLEVPDINVEQVEAPEIEEPNDDSLFSQMTFTVTKVQEDIIKQALEYIKEMGVSSQQNNENKNSNGNAITEIVVQWQKLRT